MKPLTLRLGNTGDDVRKWQRVIGVPETGRFDQGTDDATRAWQRLRGLEPDGVVGGMSWGVAGYTSERLVPVLRTTPTMADYVRAVVRAWPLVGDGFPTEASVAVLWSQYMIETGGRSCFGWNIGNAKHFKGDGFDYHMLRGVWEGVTPVTAGNLIAAGLASRDPSPDHAKAVGAGRVSVLFEPPHPQTWFRAFGSLDEGMREHLQLLRRRFNGAWPSVLAGDFGGFARALKAQGYFTADAGAYAAGMRRPFEALVASATYEDLVLSMNVAPEMEPVLASVEEAVLWDVERELATLVSVAHVQASGLIVEDMLDEYRRSRQD